MMIDGEEQDMDMSLPQENMMTTTHNKQFNKNCEFHSLNC